MTFLDTSPLAEADHLQAAIEVVHPYSGRIDDPLPDE
jgi:hypothetical protein